MITNKDVIFRNPHKNWPHHLSSISLEQEQHVQYMHQIQQDQCSMVKVQTGAMNRAAQILLINL